MPVGNGLRGNAFWIVTEHGYGADYVKNIRHDPRMRVKVGRHWHRGTAHILPDDDLRQRLRLVGTQQLTIRVDLEATEHRRLRLLRPVHQPARRTATLAPTALLGTEHGPPSGPNGRVSETADALAHCARGVRRDDMRSGLLGIPWIVCATAAFVVATVFVFVVPRSANTTGLEYLVLRWFHSLVWVLLGLAALAAQFLPSNERLAGAFAQLALVVYVVYLITFVRAA